MLTIGIIGGSGLEKPEHFEFREEIRLSTPYGEPSSALRTGMIAGARVVFLSRHDRDHSIPPTFINNRANIAALKSAGCDCILSSAACGSLREEIRPGDLVVPDQFIDFTRLRPLSFFERFEEGKLMHVAMPDPFAAPLRKALTGACESFAYPVHQTATIITIEGSRFSTRAESRMFRAWGADLVNMSTAPEVILANETGLPYAVIAVSTDYDAWREHDEAVSWELILDTFAKNVDRVTKVMIKTIESLNSLNPQDWIS